MSVPLQRPWHVPVRLDEVPEDGLHLDLVAGEEVRAALAARAGLRDLPRLEAAIDIARHGAGLRARGRVSATVGQTCVVSLEPMESQVDEDFDVVFVPPQNASALAAAATAAADADVEPMHDGSADLGAVAAEYLLLGVDPYPRRPDAEFSAPGDGDLGPGAFSALLKLRGRAAD